MAEHILKAKLNELGVLDVKVSSAGLYVYPDGSLTDMKAIRALKILGITARRKKARQFTDKMKKTSDFIITMTLRQKLEIFSNKVFTFGELTNSGDVDDPYQQSQEVYDKIAFMINLQMPALIKKLKLDK